MLFETSHRHGAHAGCSPDAGECTKNLPCRKAPELRRAIRW